MESTTLAKGVIFKIKNTNSNVYKNGGELKSNTAFSPHCFIFSV